MKFHFRAIPCLSAISFLFISGFFFRVPSVYSQQIGLSISPPILEVFIEPGKEITKAYELANKSDHDLYLVPKIVTFVPKDIYGNIKLLSTNHQPPATNLFSLANSNLDLGKPFILTANNSQQLVLKIDIPPDYQEKDLYQTFLIEQSDKGGFIERSGGKSLIKIGSNILLSVAEKAAPEKKAEIEKFIPKPKFADLFDQIEFKIIAKNSGRHFYKTHGNINISHLWFNYQKELNPLPENVLAQSSRQVNCAGPTKNQNEENIENWSVENCKFNSWLPGPYQAQLNISLENSQPTSKTVNFWLIPYKALLALLISGFIVWKIRKEFRLRTSS